MKFFWLPAEDKVKVVDFGLCVFKGNLNMKVNVKAIEPATYGTTVTLAKRRFGLAYFSGRRVAYGAAVVGFTSGVLFHYFLGIIPSVAIALGVESIRVGVASYQLRRRPLIAQLLQFSLGIDNASIVHDLFVDRSRRGYKKLAEQYLLNLQEENGTRFYEILAILRDSRQWRKLAQSFGQA
ncbi:MAG: hypothetical protein WC901_01705 [Candidatus Margulisiibacteriota bacterium]